MAKIAAVGWTILWIYLFFEPGVRMSQLGVLGSPTSNAVIVNNMQICFVGWSLGIIAIAALKIIFADPPRLEGQAPEHGATRSEPRA